MNDTLKSRTREALGNDIVDAIASKKFCILGCGAVGSLFAEMLVRSGATKLSLIDGDKVAYSNLNRTVAFVKSDVKKPKVEALKARLESINNPLFIDCLDYMFRQPFPDDVSAHKGMELVTAAHFVVIAMDDVDKRIICEKLCVSQKIDQLSIGVETKPDGDAFFECVWNGKTNEQPSSDFPEGYGHGSYASIVMEATAAGFGMMLAHLRDEESDYNYLSQDYEKFRPMTQKFKYKS